MELVFPERKNITKNEENFTWSFMLGKTKLNILLKTSFSLYCYEKNIFQMDEKAIQQM